MYEHLPIERLRALLVVAQRELNQAQTTQTEELAARIIEELQRAIWEKECEQEWKL